MWGKSCDKIIKSKACLFIDGKPLDCLATPPKERYINSVDADLLCLGFSDEETLKTYGLTKERGKGEAHKEKS